MCVCVFVVMLYDFVFDKHVCHYILILAQLCQSSECPNEKQLTPGINVAHNMVIL